MNYEQIMAYAKDKMAEEVKKDFPSGGKWRLPHFTLRIGLKDLQ